MKGNMFHLGYGVILAIDVSGMDGIKMLVEVGEELEGVVGYKPGALSLLCSNGLPSLSKEMRKITGKPLIMDWQKLVPDYPMEEPTREALIESAKGFSNILKRAKIQGAVIYPSLTAFDPLPQTVYTERIAEKGVEPFVVGRFTSDGGLIKEGGVLPDNTPELIYEQAAKEGVKYFIMPGNRPEEVGGFMELVLKNMPVPEPEIGMPGHGLQGGTIKEGFKSTLGYPTYAIIGPVDCIDMTDKNSIKESLKPYCDEALGFI